MKSSAESPLSSSALYIVRENPAHENDAIIISVNGRKI
jgi:hypothetical protein